MKGFFNFIREQGVVGLAVGFILGGAISKVVASLVNDIINPVLSIAFGATGELKTVGTEIGSVKIMWGSLLGNTVDFLTVAFVVYFGIKLLRLDKLDKKKTPPKESPLISK